MEAPHRMELARGEGHAESAALGKQEPVLKQQVVAAVAAAWVAVLAVVGFLKEGHIPAEGCASTTPTQAERDEEGTVWVLLSSLDYCVLAEKEHSAKVEKQVDEMPCQSSWLSWAWVSPSLYYWTPT